MSYQSNWLVNLGETGSIPVDGLVLVESYDKLNRPPEEVIMMEKAQAYGAYAVFFEVSQNERAPVAQAFIYISNNLNDDKEFAELHKRLWNWGGVPLVYRKKAGLVELYRCAHKPDFISPDGTPICNPVKTLNTASDIANSEPWWDASLLRNGGLWDKTEVCSQMLSANQSAHRKLVSAVESLYLELKRESTLPVLLARRLLILSLLVAYLEERGAFPDAYFSKYVKGATRFFEVLSNGPALVRLLNALEKKFNGHVFSFSNADIDILANSEKLDQFASLVEAKSENDGQLTLWQLYSFGDLPVEVISHIYQLFVDDSSSSIYTPPFLVRLILEEVLTFDRMDQMELRNEVILDPACGSGVFLVEAYKRLVLHWRMRNNWKEPSITQLKKLLTKVHGIDLDRGAVELTAFSLCLSLCDALQPAEIRASIGLFPQLMEKTVHHCCFFEARERKLIKKKVGVIVGNPPFKSGLSTEAAKRSYDNFSQEIVIPDKQLAYLFLQDSMCLLEEGGILGMLQSYNFLYNMKTEVFRNAFFSSWNVREILDFVSIRGLFTKGGADIKVVAVVAEASPQRPNDKTLHATFRRSGRAGAQREFDLNYYDINWLDQHTIQTETNVWRSNLLGGPRVAAFSKRMSGYPTLRNFADQKDWDIGEGYIAATSGSISEAEHITGKNLLPADGLTNVGINEDKIVKSSDVTFRSPYNQSRYTPPMLLIKKHMDLSHSLWTRSYLTYKEGIVGIPVPKSDLKEIVKISNWLDGNKKTLKAYIATISPRLFTRKATAVGAYSVYSIPYPANQNLELSENETIVVNDVVDYYRDLIRLGEKSLAMSEMTDKHLTDFNNVFCKQVNAIYKSAPLKPLQAMTWPGVICQPYVFGDGLVDWNGAEQLKEKIEGLFHQQMGQHLTLTRVARVYSENYIFLLKPTNLRFWLKTVALRDSDETLVDLRRQGF